MSDQTRQSQPNEYDSPWKEIVKSYFIDFISFFLPEAYDGIDWRHQPEFLDKELDRITREAKAKNRRVDLLVKVWLVTGDELWMLIHVEIQGDRDGTFPERMYTGQYRAFDLHRKPVIGLAILTDEDVNWRPSEYRLGKFGSEVVYRFNTVKLLDYREHFPSLEQSNNPFAVVTMAHLAAKQTRNQLEARYSAKWQILYGLYQRGFTRQQIIDLFRFIDWILSLPEDADKRFWQELSNFEEQRKMSYITSVERIGMERGMERGIQIGEQRGLQIGEQKGAASMLCRQLQRRFQVLPEWAASKIAEADLATLEIWSDRVLDAQTLEEVLLTRN
ncbi:MAG: DUF4351 domain-containing protein [Magnetococcales bacterium]|nr:DUF4351 domain-containing protein [Magnetococcales bacterium]NGZ25438.1 DUF4351 domain-containing protein [Magnetococcales bacterium]